MGEKLDKMLDAVFKLVYGPPAQESVSQPELRKIQTAGDVVAKLADVAYRIEVYEKNLGRFAEAIQSLEESLKKTQAAVLLSILLSIGSIVLLLLLK